MHLFKYKLTGEKNALLILGEPTVRDCEGILNPATTSELIGTAAEYLSKNTDGIDIRERITASDMLFLRIALAKWLAELKQDEAYRAPHILPDDDDTPLPYACRTTHIKAVAEYARMSFPEVYALPITEFWKLFRDAVIWNYSRTKEGIDKLEHAKNMSQTEPDRGRMCDDTVIARRSRGDK